MPVSLYTSSKVYKFALYFFFDNRKHLDIFHSFYIKFAKAFFHEKFYIFIMTQLYRAFFIHEKKLLLTITATTLLIYFYCFFVSLCMFSFFSFPYFFLFSYSSHTIRIFFSLSSFHFYELSFTI